MKPDLSSLPKWSRTWAENRLAQASHDISREQWNGLRDWLTALPIERPKMPAKLHKLTIAQALNASALWHEDMARRAERIRDDQSSFGGDPSAVQVLADGGQGWQWVRVTSPEGLDYEGNAMGHCVGSGGYDTGVTIISLRDKNNMPHCTIEWDEANRIVRQVQGRANSPVVEKYHRSVATFINGLEPLAVQNAGKFGHVFTKGELVHWSKLPDGLTLETLDLAGCTGITHLPDDLDVKTCLSLKCCTGLTHLQDGLTTKYLDLSGCTGLTHLPDELTAEIVNICYCTSLIHLPDGLTAKRLYLNDCTGLTQLPDGLIAEYLNLEGCTGLTHLSNGLSAEYLILAGCTSLTHLPDGLSLQYLRLEGCTGLTHLPDRLNVKSLDLCHCTGLTHLPDGLSVKQLDLRSCTGLTHLPDRLTTEHLNISGCTGLTSLPSDLNMDCRVLGGDHLIRRSTPRI